MRDLPPSIDTILRSEVLDLTADAVIIIDGNHTILYFSRSAERTFGYAADEICGQPLTRLLLTDSNEGLGRRMQRLAAVDVHLANLTDRLPALCLRRDGSEFPAEITVARLIEAGQRLLVVAVRDVSQHTLAEEALRDSEERYRSIVTAMSEGIVMQDATGRIVACNASAERILGLTRDQMMGLTSLDPRWQATYEDGSLVPGEEHPIRVTLRTGQPMSDVVMSVRRADGTRVWMTVNTQPLFRSGATRPYSVVASFADITHQKQAELVLRESEARYRALFQNTIDAVLLTAPDGSIFAANPEACRLLGRTEEEIRRAGRSGVVDLADPRVTEALDERARTGQFRKELTLIRGDGSRFEAEVSSSVFKDRDGNLRTSMVFRDITERKQAYHVLEERVAERAGEIAALLEVSRNVTSLLELAPLLSAILTQLKAVLECTGAGIAILEDGHLKMVAYQGAAVPAEMLDRIIPLDRDSGYLQVIQRRGPVIIEDIWADTPWASTVRAGWARDELDVIAASHAWLGVPLIVKEKLIGVLRIDHSQPARFTEQDARLAMAFAQQAAVAIEIVRLYERAQHAAVLEERQRLARELHDSVSQALYGMVLGARTAHTLIERSPAEAQEPLKYVISLAETAFAEMRALIFELRPDSLEAEGLVAALTREADRLRTRHHIDVLTELDAEPAITLEAKEALYRILQEVANNIAKHAAARHVAIRFRHMPGTAILEVVDDGVGFDPAVRPPGHMGLRSIQERAEQLGGICRIESEIGKGTRIEVRISVSNVDPSEKS
ncbi:MAG: PAS domain S-box protein [Anaerolineae bacterium]|nr:PAS domain S-box protein [Anaerolineae bacterium]